MNEIAMREMLDRDLDHAWEPQLPPGMSPLGQSADRDWTHLSWYENGALAEAALKEFPPVKTAIDRLLTYVVGDGFNLNPNTGDQKLDDDLEQYFLDIAHISKEIDFDEESNLSGVCRKLLRGALVTGGHFAQFVSREATGTVGKVQLIEAYRCKTPYTKSDRERIVGGVQLAKHSRKQIGYWFEKDDIGDWGQFLLPAGSEEDFQYLPAEDEEGNKHVVHFRLPDRTSGTKSDGVFTCANQALFQQKRIRINTWTKAEISTAISLMKEIDMTAPNSQSLVEQVNRKIMNEAELGRGLPFKPGQSFFVPGGMKATVINPDIPTEGYFDLDAVLLRELAALFWISLELLRLDASTSNYSSIRMLMKASEPGFRYFQGLLDYGFLRHWWAFKLRDLMFADGAIRRAVERHKYNPHLAKWDYPGWQGLDPEKDIQGDIDKATNGLASESRVAQERGINFTKEKPRVVADQVWTAELVADAVEEPDIKAKLAKIGISSREAFCLIYAKTTPNGIKAIEALAKLKAAEAAEKKAIESINATES